MSMEKSSSMNMEKSSSMSMEKSVASAIQTALASISSVQLIVDTAIAVDGLSGTSRDAMRELVSAWSENSAALEAKIKEAEGSNASLDRPPTKLPPLERVPPTALEMPAAAPDSSAPPQAPP